MATSLLHQDTCECTKSELAIFDMPPTQITQEKGQWTAYHPITNTLDGGPLEFQISGNDEYIDLANSQLFVRAKITKADGSNLDADQNVGPVNNWLQSLFSQVDVLMNGKVISPSSNTYPYRCMIETLLNYGNDAKESQLTAQLFYKDTAGKMDVVRPTEANATANLGLKARYEFTKESAAVSMVGRIHSDMFLQPRLLLSHVDMTIRLNRAKSLFCLVSSEGGGATFKAVIQEAVLRMRKVKVSPSVILEHTATLAKTTAKYPIQRVDCKVFSVPAGNMSINQDNLFLGNVPQRVIVAMVDTDSFNGSYTKNPFNFKHYNANFVGLFLNGEQVPHRPLKLSYRTAGGVNNIMGYYSLFTGTGKSHHDSGNQISRNDYAQGYTLYSFNLTPDLSDDAHLQLVKSGSLRLEVQFDQALAQTINVIVYAQYQSLIQINSRRNIICDFAN